MSTRRTNRGVPTRIALGMACILTCGFVVQTAWSQSKDQSTPTETATTIDEVVAVVNRQTILKSDIEDELQLSVLDPSNNGQEQISEAQALDNLISRTLIQQQIRQEELPATEPTPAQVTARVEEIRNELPACVRANCQTDEGWKIFLARHELTPARVEAYLLNRLEILSFIEARFRQGIRISPEDVQKYYRETLLPQYPAGQKPPPLEQVSNRIEEILLQQQVNVLFDTWLANLRKQGQIEVLDPALEAATTTEKQKATKE
jgi:peptidyl-prolyl cis-trans isomerase SurA